MIVEQKPNQGIANVLIVDDVPDNLKILSDILKSEGHKVRPVLSGIQALQVAEIEKPDIILLDIMMPDFDGFEVCQHLKKNPYLQDIPIIFISALNNTNDIVKALQLGGVDYITKPFQAEEVTARVSTHLKICRQNRELVQLNKEKDKFLSIIAHDLHGPLGTFAELTGMMVNESFHMTEEKKNNLMQRISQSSRNLCGLLENLLKWSKLQNGHIQFDPQALPLKNEVISALETISESAVKKSIEIVTEFPDEIEVFADKNMLQTILRNLISNAVKFTPRGGRVTVFAVREDRNVAITIKDTGIGMRKEILDTLFNIDSKNQRPGTEGEPSTGLGLILSKEFVENQGGKIYAESESGRGSVFQFSLPSP